MIIDGYWLKLIWAVLAGGWFISALIVPAIAGVFFLWQHGRAGPLPAFVPLEETYRNLAALLLVTWAILDGIRGGVPAGRQNPKFS